MTLLQFRHVFNNVIPCEEESLNDSIVYSFRAANAYLNHSVVTSNTQDYAVQIYAYTVQTLS